jgi:hypothetical protein
VSGNTPREEETTLARAERMISHRATEYGLRVVFGGPDDRRTWKVFRRRDDFLLGTYTPQGEGRYVLRGAVGYSPRPFQVLRLFRDAARAK